MIAIRGLDTDLYNQAFSLAKNSNRNVADVVNEALKTYLVGLNAEEHYHDGAVKVARVKNDGFITLSKKDIIALKKEAGEFIVETNNRLVLEKDVDRGALDCIQSIVINGGSLEVPRDIYPLVLLKSEVHGKVEKY